MTLARRDVVDPVALEVQRLVLCSRRFPFRNRTHGISRCCWVHARYKPGNLHYPGFRAVRDMASGAEECPDLLSAAANEVTERTCIRSAGSRGHGPLPVDNQAPPTAGGLP